MTLFEHEIITTAHLAAEWGIRQTTATQRAIRWAKRLGIERREARSLSGQIMVAFCKDDAHRILAAYLESEVRRKNNETLKEKKQKDVAFEIGTGERDDVMTIHELADEFRVSRSSAVKIARRLEHNLGIERVPARATSGQKIIAYERSDGRKIVAAHQARLGKKDDRRKAKEMREIERERIPRPRPPGSKTELLYLIQMSPTDHQVFKIGWTSDIEERVRSYKTANPLLHVVKTWACNRERDSAAMKHLFQFDAIERIGKEVFRTEDINGVITHLDDFF